MDCQPPTSSFHCHRPRKTILRFARPGKSDLRTGGRPIEEATSVWLRVRHAIRLHLACGQPHSESSSCASWAEQNRGYIIRPSLRGERERETESGGDSLACYSTTGNGFSLWQYHSRSCQAL
jgi:hypothetical protein